MDNIVSNNFNRKTTLFFSIVLLSMIYYSASAQKKKFKDYLFIGSSSFVSGMLDGTIESISYHYENGFKRRFPKANDRFWNPSISWTNKYKNNNPALGPKFTGSTNVFVFTTDAYHMLRTTKRSIDGLTLACYINKACSEKGLTKKKRWKQVAKDFLIVTAIRSVGFTLTYNVVFKQPSSTAL